MEPRVATYGGAIETALGRTIDFPKLSSTDHAQIRSALDSRGFRGTQIPHVNSPIDFSNIHFPSLVTFVGFVFGGTTNFDGTTFTGGTPLFVEAVFGGNPTFEDSAFHVDAIFNKCAFPNGISFDSTTFFGQAIFSGSQFHGQANFKHTTFHRSSYFNKSTFKAITDFSNSTFLGAADFGSVKFERPTHFREASFEAQVPNFFESDLYEYTDWHNSRWPVVPDNADSARSQVQHYQRLVLLMDKLHKPDDQHFFFRREMRARRRAEPIGVSTAMNWIYEFICDYGHGIGRIASIWLLHIVVGAVLILALKSANSPERELSWRYVYELISDLIFALGISFSNSHALLALGRSFLDDAVESWSRLPLFNVIGAVQTTLGVVLLFFLLLTVRNRFRMR